MRSNAEQKENPDPHVQRVAHSMYLAKAVIIDACEPPWPQSGYFNANSEEKKKNESLLRNLVGKE